MADQDGSRAPVADEALCTWEELGACDENLEPGMGKTFIRYPCFEDPTRGIPLIKIFGVAVPKQYYGENPVTARLRERFDFVALAIETPCKDPRRLKLCTRSSVLALSPGLADTPPGLGVDVQELRLWVVLPPGGSSRGILKFSNLTSEEDIQTRWLKINSFLVSSIPKWVGKSLKKIGMGEHNINVIGITRGNSEEGGDALFPNPYSELHEGDSLLVLKPHLEKLEAIAEAARKEASPTKGAASRKAAPKKLASKVWELQQDVDQLKAEKDMREQANVEQAALAAAAWTQAMSLAAMYSPPMPPMPPMMPPTMGNPLMWQAAYAAQAAAAAAAAHPAYVAAAVQAMSPAAGAHHHDGTPLGFGTPQRRRERKIGRADGPEKRARSSSRSRGALGGVASVAAGALVNKAPNGAVGGAATSPWAEVEPLLGLSDAEQMMLGNKSRKMMAEEKLKAVDVLERKQPVVANAYDRASEGVRACIREKVLERVFELSKDDCGCVLVKHLLKVSQAEDPWAELGADKQMDVAPTDLSLGGGDINDEGVDLQIFALEVPRGRAGQTLRELKLREKYHFCAVVLESGGELDVRIDQPLPVGSKLWVGLEDGTTLDQALGCLEEFLGKKPDMVCTRLLRLRCFSIDERKDWLGMDLIENRIRKDYGVTVIGIISGRTGDSDNIVLFPRPTHVLKEGDRLVVLKPDLERLQVSSSPATRSQSSFVEELVESMRVVDLVKDKNGCHVIREAFCRMPEYLKRRLWRRLQSFVVVDKTKYVKEIDRNHLLEQVIKSQHGIHVIREILRQALFNNGFGPENDEIVGTLLEIVEDQADVRLGDKKALPPSFVGPSGGALLDKRKFSYRLVLWLIEYFSYRDRGRIQGLLDCFAHNAQQLIDENNGSILLSSVLEYGEGQREKVFRVILDRVDDISRSNVKSLPKFWYPSFLIDKLIVDNRKIVSMIDGGKADLKAALLRGENLLRIQEHRSGKYTARRIYYELAESEEERREFAKVCPKLLEVEQDADEKRPQKRAETSFNDSLFRESTHSGQV